MDCRSIPRGRLAIMKTLKQSRSRYSTSQWATKRFLRLGDFKKIDVLIGLLTLSGIKALCLLCDCNDNFKLPDILREVIERNSFPLFVGVSRAQRFVGFWFSFFEANYGNNTCKWIEQSINHSNLCSESKKVF